MSDASLTPELYCKDIKCSLDFYTKILGFKIVYDRPENYFAMLDYQGARLMIEQLDKRNRVWLKDKLEYPFGRGVSFQIKTNDVLGLYKKVKNANSEVFLPLEERWYRANDKEVGNKQFIVVDPDGFLLRFFEDMGERPIQSKLD